MKTLLNSLLLIIFCHFANSQSIQLTIEKGNTFYYQAKYDSAKYTFKTLLDNSKNISEKQLAQIHLANGNCFRMTEDFKNAYPEYLKAIRLFKKDKDFNGLMLCYLELMEHNRILAKWEEVYYYFHLVENLNRQFNANASTKARYFNRKAAFYSEVKSDNKAAIDYSNKAIFYASKIKDTFTLASSYNQLAFGYGAMKNNEIAHQYYHQSLSLFKQIKNDRYVVDLYMNLTRYFQQLKQIDSSNYYGIKGYNLSEANSFMHAHQMFCLLLYENATGKNDYKSALNYHIKYVEIGSENEKNRWNKYLYDLEKKYKVTIKEQELKENKNKLKVKELTLQKSHTTIYITFIILFFISLLLFLLVYFYFKQRKTNKRLNELLSENQFLLEESNHRIKNNLQLVTSLLNRKLNGEKDEFNKLKTVLDEIEAISTLHKHIYLNNDKTSVNLEHYLLDIKSNFNYLLQDNNIQLDFDVQSLQIENNKAMYLGLLFTECIINSIKHAFLKTAKPRISLQIKTMENNQFCWKYTDNGKGLSKNEVPELALMMCKQLKADYHFSKTGGFQLDLILKR